MIARASSLLLVLKFLALLCLITLGETRSMSSKITLDEEALRTGALLVELERDLALPFEEVGD